MSASLRLSWRPRVSLAAGELQATVEAPGSRFALRRPRPEIIDAMRRLTPPGEDENLLAESVLTAGGADSLARWLHCLKELGHRGLIRQSLCVGERPLATLVPVAGMAPPRVERGVDSRAPRGGDDPVGQASASAFIGAGNGQAINTPAASYLLSRFAYLRRVGGEMVLESPLAHSRIVLHDPRAAALIAALTTAATAAELARRVEGISLDAVQRFIDLIVEARMLDPLAAGAPLDDIAAGPLETWEFHDLLFHSRSRRGRSDSPYGGTYRLANRPPPPSVKPPLKQAVAGDGYALHRPDIEKLASQDPPLALVQERRRSIREYGKQPITSRQLGEFLYRVARVKETRQVETQTPSGTVPIEMTSRPYPAGGALYELEFYAVVRACQDLKAGLHHYDPVEHRLDRVDGCSSHTEKLLDEAAASAGIAPAGLQVLIVLAVRLERIAWKYESIAYALVLKHVGVVYQTMYLAATAMGLAPCALGCGDSDVFARASGIDYYAETSVGEFLLGSRA